MERSRVGSFLDPLSIGSCPVRSPQTSRSTHLTYPETSLMMTTRLLVLARIIHDASAAIAHPKQVTSLESTEVSDSRAKSNRMALDFASAGATHLAAPLRRPGGRARRSVPQRTVQVRLGPSRLVPDPLQQGSNGCPSRRGCRDPLLWDCNGWNATNRHE